MQQTTYTAKDTIVSMAASITSLLGAVSHIMLDVSLANGHSSTNIDARAHARFIMVLAATTNMLSAVMLYPVYSMIVFQTFITCTVTDVSASIMSVVDAAGNNKQPSMSIKFKDNMDEATEKAGVATCLTEDVKQSLEDAAGQLRASRKQDRTFKDEFKITRLIRDAISNAIDTVLAAKIQCPTGSASIDCCIYSKRENMVFGLNNLNLQQQQATWDMSNNIVTHFNAFQKKVYCKHYGLRKSAILCNLLKRRYQKQWQLTCLLHLLQFQCKGSLGVSRDGEVQQVSR
jgi:hypothetical protein